MKILIAYWSGTGNTEKMAFNIADELKKGENDVDIKSVCEENIDVKDYDVLFLGCPAMGAEELEEMEFQPFYDSIKSCLNGKKVGLFGTYGWGDGEWMRTWALDAKACGAIMLLDDGLACQEDESDIEEQCSNFAKKCV